MEPSPSHFSAEIFATCTRAQMDSNNMGKQTNLTKKKKIAVASFFITIIILSVAIIVPLSLPDNNHRTNDKTVTATEAPATQITAKDNLSPAYAHAVSPYANLTLLKTYEPAADNNRIFVMGDVHGRLAEMNALLENIQFQPGTDALIMAGDLVFRGNDSIGVLQRARQIGALCVRGNHDDKVIRFKVYEQQHGEAAMLFDLEKVLPEGHVRDPLKFKNKHAALARELNVEDFEYLASCPLILDIPQLNARVVHGGLDPAITNVVNNDPWSVMNMRNMDSDLQPSKSKLSNDSENGAQHWTAVYQAYALKHNNQSATVYYGHDASRGLDIGNYTIGLDSGCVYGRRLSVMEIKTKILTQVLCE